ncbi:hypothetical protein [Acidovorax sp. SUPP2539]|uniref:hypothetical protein n=1 Tax=Acidovorax sp. SUPP2539 TaxID=2920878 RepID=UPI0023DE2AE7|nr:hypothetical protein [Acidovorax sp. SUPP2539]GKS91229.1 hypothetical protein AVTE2539_17710 [Acidovorax sp. SUPP2539]
MNIRRGLQRLSATIWTGLAIIGLMMTLAVASDPFRAGDMSKAIEVTLIGVVVSLGLGYGGHKLVCWIIQGFTSDRSL